MCESTGNVYTPDMYVNLCCTCINMLEKCKKFENIYISETFIRHTHNNPESGYKNIHVYV